MTRRAKGWRSSRVGVHMIGVLLFYTDMQLQAESARAREPAGTQYSFRMPYQADVEVPQFSLVPLRACPLPRLGLPPNVMRIRGGGRGYNVDRTFSPQALILDQRDETSRDQSPDIVMATQGSVDSHVSTLVLLRHGQSVWNAENRFTGWMDVPLAPAGVRDAHHAADLCREEGLSFDMVFTSVLQRAANTSRIILEDLGHHDVPIRQEWTLNERHDGNLTGMNKKLAVLEYGKENVNLWRRSYAAAPPPLDTCNPGWPGHDPRYKNLGLETEDLPLTESLMDVENRVSVVWEEILALLRDGKNVMVVTHGNVVRILAKMLDSIPDEDIDALDIPQCCPLVYKLHREILTPIKLPNTFPQLSGKFLGDQDVVKEKMKGIREETGNHLFARDIRQILRANDWIGVKDGRGRKDEKKKRGFRKMSTTKIDQRLVRTISGRMQVARNTTHWHKRSKSKFREFYPQDSV